jgi:hypothetical protein
LRNYAAAEIMLVNVPDVPILRTIKPIKKTNENENSP